MSLTDRLGVTLNIRYPRNVCINREHSIPIHGYVCHGYDRIKYWPALCLVGIDDTQLQVIPRSDVFMLFNTSNMRKYESGYIGNTISVLS